MTHSGHGGVDVAVRVPHPLRSDGDGAFPVAETGNARAAVELSHRFRQPGFAEEGLKVCLPAQHYPTQRHGLPVATSSALSVARQVELSRARHHHGASGSRLADSGQLNHPRLSGDLIPTRNAAAARISSNLARRGLGRRTQVTLGDGGIALSGRDRAVPQHFLYRADLPVPAALSHVSQPSTALSHGPGRA